MYAIRSYYAFVDKRLLDRYEHLMERLEGAPERQLTWTQLVTIAHRNIHKMPPGMEPGLQAKFVWEVPTGGGLPTPDGRIQIYPCYSFEVHVVAVEIDRDSGKPSIGRYVVGHDCGVMINPDIVHGMTYGGIARNNFV